MPKVKLIIPGRLENLERIGEFVTRAAKEAGLNPSEVYAVQLAVDEAATNIIEHAYGGDGHGDIECSCQALADGLKIVLSDKGRPFIPEHIPEPEINVPLDMLKSRGLGVFLIKKMMSEVSFKSSPGKGNRLTMIKRRG